ncbi:N-acetylneuraminate synthase [Enterobacter mori]|uniref:N-acetylneuraminate synthase n=1 Tax=Enterobacter mori TaxID=539813 RepID=UPI001EE47746|nr:N-acetylneuraminate synthase [Enterobacter mori]MCG5130365.1 N-acetylneuraminate synthase [Enterobacter mori]
MTLIIAEAGVNHNGQRDLAFRLVDAAHDAGADIVKFQTFKSQNLVTSSAVQAEYQVANTNKTESQLAMLSRLELSYEVHKELIDYCNKLGIEFLSTAFDEESLNFLVNDLNLKTLKIPSGEITNAPFVLSHALTGCNIMLSTGMATLSEIEDALGVLAFGFTSDGNVEPSRSEFQKAYSSDAGQRALKEKVRILHCTTEYPAPMNEINLRAMDSMALAFGLPTGYSDHSQGITIPVAAVARGAVIIEKHFTLDKNMEGPDHKASLEPNELAEMVKAIRNVELALGDGVKRPTASEQKNKSIARRSIVAAKDISSGSNFSSDNIAIKRPGDGISPYEYWNMQGKTAKKDYREGDRISND